MEQWGNWTDLIESYKADLKELNRLKKPLKELLDEDKRIKEEIRKGKKIEPKLSSEQLTEIKRESELLSQMITSTTYALDWLNKGKCPDNVTSIENYSYDQRAIKMDPHLLDAIYSMDHRFNESVPPEVEGQELFKIEAALSTLTQREKDAFIMFEAQQLPISDIADMMSVKSSTVNTMLRRARHKIKANKNADLFLVDFTV